MPERKIAIVNKLGLHARAAAKFVAMASRYQCEIEVEKKGRVVNGKSIMGVMMLAAAKGSELTLKAHGDDAEEALAAMEALIENRFGEPE
ncbi:MAG TPA: HPr family phosphocarrier protein [Gammaproteobacteria bacterium]|nr:HPr family phosphocarrier protein [Gammaproteobacteria bacterium]